MKLKMKIKIIIDLLMSIALLLLMAYQIVGEELHEWFGAAMLVLFIAHTVLNIRWYGNLFKGKYTAIRVVGTVVNFAVLISMLCLAYSGITMSRYVFTFLPPVGGMALSRTMHLAASYWGFVLMSFHLGLHWGMILGMVKKAFKITKRNIVASIILKLIVAAISAYGIISFHAENIASNMFLKTEFVFFDFEASPIDVFTKYIAMMVLFSAVAYYLTRLIKKIVHKQNGVD